MNEKSWKKEDGAVEKNTRGKYRGIKKRGRGSWTDEKGMEDKKKSERPTETDNLSHHHIMPDKVKSTA